jgi:acyl dehydratase
MKPSLTVSDLSPGQTLPESVVPVTASAIVAGAMATSDFEKVHHDKAAAQASGVADIFMNILTTNGWVQRFATGWLGPAARIQKVAIKLGVPNCAGDTLRLSGEVTAVDRANATAELRIRGRNTLGEHVTATLTVALPQASR